MATGGAGMVSNKGGLFRGEGARHGDGWAVVEI